MYKLEILLLLEDGIYERSNQPGGGRRKKIINYNTGEGMSSYHSELLYALIQLKTNFCSGDPLKG